MLSAYNLLRRKVSGGVLFTLRAMGPYYLFKEIIRRLSGIPYSYRGIEICNIETFRVINALLWIGDNFGFDDNDYFIKTKYGIIYGKGHDFGTITVIDLENDYSSLNVKNNVVIDVGAYHGETALMFLNWGGARMVYAYEPVPEYYNYLVKAIKANGVEDRVRTFNYGWWFSNAILRLKLNYTSTGSLTGDVEVKVVNSTEELIKISNEVGEGFVVKMDCEGCEYSLFTVPARS